MKLIRTIFNKINIFSFREKPKVLGRWNIDYCNKRLNRKVDLSNEDHCGPCGRYHVLDNKHKSPEIPNTDFK